jgi:predicted site-specific integrase-resolvase
LKGDIEFIKSKTNRNFVSLETYNRLLGIKEHKEEYVIIYCRVSSSENKSNLETQKERLINYCNAKGYKVGEVVIEIASGVNDQRPKLSKILKDNKYSKIVVEHKDRLTRFGFNYFQLFTEVLGKEIEVVNNITSEKEDLIEDFVSIITSFCSRIYGNRRSKRNTEKLIKNLTN